MPRAVVVRPARTTVVVGTSLAYLSPVVFAAAVVARPARDRLVWEDSEVIFRNQDWVECNFGVDNRGEALLLEIQGRVQINFAEVTFGNNQVQVVDFQDRPHHNGIYTLLDFADGRQVKTVRVLARSRSPETRLTVLMRK